MKAVVLAAGFGTRLSPLTDRVPKALVDVAGEPLLARQIRYLVDEGATEVAVNVHYLPDQLRAFLADYDDAVVRAYYEPRLLGTAGALTQMREWLDEPFVVLYGDVVTDAPLRPLLDALHDWAAVVAYQRRRLDVGVVELRRADEVRRFREKPEILASVGLYALSPDVLALVRAGDDFGADVFPRLLASGIAVGCHDVTGRYLVDVGTPEGLARAREDLA